VLGYTREKNVSAAERLRDQMRRDMLADLGDEEDDVTFGRKGEAEEKRKKGETGEEAEEMDGVNWEEMVSPIKRVLSMDVCRAEDSKIVTDCWRSPPRISRSSSRSFATSISIVSGAPTSTGVGTSWKGRVDVRGRTRMIIKRVRKLSSSGHGRRSWCTIVGTGQ